MTEIDELNEVLRRIRGAQAFAEREAKKPTDDRGATLWSGKAVGLREAGDIVEAVLAASGATATT